MTDPDGIIAGLKRVIDEQHSVNCNLREQLQTAQADAEYWRGQAEAFETEARESAKRRASGIHVPWAIADEIERALSDGDCRHALRLWEREARS